MQYENEATYDLLTFILKLGLGLGLATGKYLNLKFFFVLKWTTHLDTSVGVQRHFVFCSNLNGVSVNEIDKST